MMIKKLRGEPYVTELPMPVFDRVKPAPAVKDMAHARIALITSGGIVPQGNPDISRPPMPAYMASTT